MASGDPGVFKVDSFTVQQMTQLLMRQKVIISRLGRRVPLMHTSVMAMQEEDLERLGKSTYLSNSLT